MKTFDEIKSYFLHLFKGIKTKLLFQYLWIFLVPLLFILLISQIGEKNKLNQRLIALNDTCAMLNKKIDTLTFENQKLLYAFRETSNKLKELSRKYSNLSTRSSAFKNETTTVLSEVQKDISQIQNEINSINSNIKNLKTKANNFDTE